MYKDLNKVKEDITWDKNDTRPLNYKGNTKLFNLDPKTWCMTED